MKASPSGRRPRWPRPRSSKTGWRPCWAARTHPTAKRCGARCASRCGGTAAPGSPRSRVSAVDMALWDLTGKALGRPLHELLGGKKRDRLRACASSHPHKGEIRRDGAGDRGLRGGGLHAPSRSVSARRGTRDLGEDFDRDVAFVRETRAALGPGVDFMVDVGYKVRWDLHTAIRRTAAFAEQRHPLDRGPAAKGRLGRLPAAARPQRTSQSQRASGSGRRRRTGD